MKKLSKILNIFNKTFIMIKYTNDIKKYIVDILLYLKIINLILIYKIIVLKFNYECIYSKM